MELVNRNTLILLPILLNTAEIVSCTTCYRHEGAITITLFCSYGCCEKDGKTVCCDRSVAGALTLFTSDLSGAAVIGLVVSFIITLCIVVALVCFCVKKKTQSSRVDTTTNVAIATVTTHQPQYPIAYSQSALMTGVPSYSSFASYGPPLQENGVSTTYGPHVTSASFTTVT